PGIVLRTLTKFGKLALRLACLSAIEFELSMRNRMSISRLMSIGMSLYSTRPCCGMTSETDRSGQPATSESPASEPTSNVQAWRIAHLQCSASIEQVARQVEVRAVSNACFSPAV